MKSFFRLFIALLLASCNTPNTPQNISPSSKEKILRISMENDPSTLDPRTSRSLSSVTVMHMLFEGLMRTGPDGQPAPALAQEVNISPDRKTYTFTLRKSNWSNGDPVTAEDFVYSWKSMLDPAFPSPNAFQLFAIKGAKEAKEGKDSLDQVSIQAPDAHTLIVELHTPCPYFLTLVSSYAFLPVNRLWDKSHPEWRKGKEVVSNGPFVLDKWAHGHGLEVKKNPSYWDAHTIQLDRIHLMMLDNHTAFQMFAGEELDWTGSPLSTLSADSLGVLRERGLLHAKPAAGTYWFRLNTEKAPLQDVKMRQALSYAIDRHAITEHVLQGGQKPATGIIPPCLHSQKCFRDHQLEKARELFSKVLEKGEIAPITITYRHDERAHKIAQAVQQQWKRAFGIQVELQALESKVYFNKLSRQDYQVSIGSWFADFLDPINLLDVFKYKSFSTNNTQWENPEYIALLDQSSLEADQNKREKMLQQAERVLMRDMPVIPLFYASLHYVKNEKLHDVYFSELGYLDFKHAHFQ